MAIKLEEHIKNINGVDYIPFEIVQRYIAENYTKQFDELSQLMDKAFKDYDKGIKDILEND